MIILNNVIAFQRFLEDYDLHVQFDRIGPDSYMARVQNKRGDNLQRDWAPLTGCGPTEARAYRALVNRLSDYKYAYIGGKCVGLPTPIWVDSEWVERDRYWTLDTWQGYIAIVFATAYIIYDYGKAPLIASCKNLEDGKKQVEAYYDY
jgi:hypothetical protein